MLAGIVSWASEKCRGPFAVASHSSLPPPLTYIWYAECNKARCVDEKV
jgi:hypothetical protein